jgi:hypothetical protein
LVYVLTAAVLLLLLLACIWATAALFCWRMFVLLLTLLLLPALAAARLLGQWLVCQLLLLL